MGRLSGQDRLETKIDTIDSIVDNLHDTDIPDLHTDIADLHVDIADIHTDVAANNTILVDLHNTDIPDLHTGIADLHTDIADIHTDVATAATVHTNIYAVSAVSGYAHLNRERTYGVSAGLISECTPAPLTVTGGDNAWGTSVLIYKAGGFPEGQTYLFPTGIIVTAVGTANKHTFVRFVSSSGGTNTAYTMEADDDIITSNAHGLVNGDRVIFTSISPDETHGITSFIVYYVVNKTDNTFQVSLTSGGSAVTVDLDLSGNFKKISSTTYSGSILVTRTATTCDGYIQKIQPNRVTDTMYFWVDAKTETLSTVQVSFYLTGYESNNA